MSGPGAGATVPAPPATLRLQVLSDLHLETESYDPAPADGADALVLAGDIDATWRAYRRFAGWPVPVYAVAGNHEFDGREWLAAWPALRELGAQVGLTWLEHDEATLVTAAGARARLLGCTRWSDFGAFGEAGRPRAERAAAHFQRLMRASIGGRPLDVDAVRAIGEADRAWLASALRRPAAVDVDATVVVTHFAPSLRCADPRYGLQPGTASFCNADDDLLPFADLWLHGHLHSRHDLRLTAPDAPDGAAATRVVCRARGHGRRGESDGHDALTPLIELPLRRDSRSSSAVWNTAAARPG